MMDRVSANPGRVLITPEDGSGAFYATLAMADNPTVVGDPLNKNTFLTDATAALYGLGPAAVPDDVLARCVKYATGSYVGTGTYGAGNPNTIMLNFTPKIAIISTSSFSPAPREQNGWGDGMIAVYPATKVFVYDSVAAASELTWGDDYFSWYTQAVGTNSERAQLNKAGTTYGWLILG